MKKFIRLKKVNRPHETVVLDTENGQFSPQLPGEAADSQGNYMSIAGQDFSVFAADNHLYFQWNRKRWNLQDLGPKVKYAHDIPGKTTTFSVDDEHIRYPAWWVGDATFDPSLPERDEDEDFLAYVANLAQNQALQKMLIQSWDR